MPIEQPYMQNVIDVICNHQEQLNYVFTAVANSVQERISEDVEIIPYKCDRSDPNYKEDLKAIVLPFEAKNESGKEFKTHFIMYGVPADIRFNDMYEDLLARTLDVAHELGHLLLQNKPRNIKFRPNVYENEEDKLKKINEIEADWMAICLLHMYGYIFPRCDKCNESRKNQNAKSEKVEETVNNT